MRKALRLHRRSARVAGLAVAAVLVATGVSACSDDSSSAPDGELVGLFRLTPGSATGSTVTGTYFRMIQPGGTADAGPYMINANSPADGGRATILEPGTAGGLRTGGYQTQPTPAFGVDGDSLAASITKPTKFFAVEFSISTNPVDLQSRAQVAPPTVRVQDGKLIADLSSWSASWNRQDFNQGAPKPVSRTGAQAPGQQGARKAWDWVAGRWLETAPASQVAGDSAVGTYDPDSKKFTLEWTSLIEGGPFNGFLGKWHLEGVFEPASRAPDLAGE
ncbi:hypothetical protein QSJ18_10270 [Gordonia sp. ABSL1-1]|uniref:hypothetical protein n=1 Tax=Gordonia sp. ABSL1-1 TaxID=3053923 RepID=UPI002574430D|nr:hypothetical protein [Gordonia sp. ABSL1-1]MDL9937127.1 hypothetical protein [Gordonia sp. ABSL1-1]